MTVMPEQIPEVSQEADDNLLSKEWWQKEFPPSVHRRMRIIMIVFAIGVAVSATNIFYVLLF
ncbi:MAG: hypothetical protein OXF74_11675 [Rhodobacteraceae bacterium]|nr:hypothetical protein [Paracoccaceae bacterium]